MLCCVLPDLTSKGTHLVKCHKDVYQFGQGDGSDNVTMLKWVVNVLTKDQVTVIEEKRRGAPSIERKCLRYNSKSGEQSTAIP